MECCFDKCWGQAVHTALVSIWHF